MTPQQFSEQLRQLCLGAIQGGRLDGSQIIGQLEIAKLNVDRYLLARSVQQTAENIVKPQIIPINGSRKHPSV